MEISFDLAISIVLFLFFIGIMLSLHIKEKLTSKQEILLTSPKAMKIAPLISLPEKITKRKSSRLDPVAICYGTQSGNASRFCTILADEAEELGFKPTIFNLEDFPLIDFLAQPLVFVVATYGEGEPTDNAREFFTWLKTKAKDLDFSHINYTVFGLGSTQYIHFNKSGRKLNKRLEKLGANRFYKYGEGDASFSLEEYFNEWKIDLFTAITEVCSQTQLENSPELEDGRNDQRRSSRRRSSYFANSMDVFQFTDETPISLDLVPHLSNYEFQVRGMLETKQMDLTGVSELRRDGSGGSTLKITISGTEFKTAQNLSIFPENDPDLVLEVAEYLDVDLAKVLKINPQCRKFKTIPFPSPISVREILCKFCDFQGIISLSSLKYLTKLTQDEDALTILNGLLSSEHSKEYRQEIISPKKTILEILKELKIVPTLSDFVILCPRITARDYTIASSSLENQKEFDIIATRVQDVLPDSRVKIGLTSQFFIRKWNELKNGKSCKISAALKTSPFLLPMQPSLPLTFICTGSGISPFRAFLQEIRKLKESQKCEYNDITLYFGCRKKNWDFLLKDEISSFKADKTLNKANIAFSREDQRHYVQDLIKLNSDEILTNLIYNHGVIYVCGSWKMGIAVNDALENCMIEKLGKTKDEVCRMLKEFEKGKQIIKELWC